MCSALNRPTIFLYILSQGEESHDKDCSTKCPGGWIYSQNRRVKGRRCLSAVSALFSSLLAVCPCSCLSGAAWSYAAVCGGNERKALGAASWSSNSPLA